MRFLNSQNWRLLSRSRPINWGGIQPGLFPPTRCENYLLSYARSIGAVDAAPGRGTSISLAPSRTPGKVAATSSDGHQLTTSMCLLDGARYWLDHGADPAASITTI